MVQHCIKDSLSQRLSNVTLTPQNCHTGLVIMQRCELPNLYSLEDGDIPHSRPFLEYTVISNIIQNWYYIPNGMFVPFLYGVNCFWLTLLLAVLITRQTDIIMTSLPSSASLRDDLSVVTPITDWFSTDKDSAIEGSIIEILRHSIQEEFLHAMFVGSSLRSHYLLHHVISEWYLSTEREFTSWRRKYYGSRKQEAGVSWSKDSIKYNEWRNHCYLISS